jgi:hypothetical protein
MINLLVPRNLEGRKEKLKHLNIKLLSQEVFDGDLNIDESFMDIDPKIVKIKKVNGDVWLEGGQWKEIPLWLKDIEISGSFYCSKNKLTTLKNCPHKIGENFSCAENKLKSLEGCPRNICENFSCAFNHLTSLKGCPEYVGGNFYCTLNIIKLKLPDYVKLKGTFIN